MLDAIVVIKRSTNAPVPIWEYLLHYKSLCFRDLVFGCIKKARIEIINNFEKIS